METDPRRSIARLAAAVMVADARVTTSEIAAIGALVRLGLGSLEAATREELTRAAHEPLDIGPACAALAEAYPDAGGTILTALADIAVSDGELDPREVALLGRIGDALDVAPAIVAHVIRSAAADADVPLPTGDRPREATPAPAARRESPAPSPATAAASRASSAGAGPEPSPTVPRTEGSRAEAVGSAPLAGAYALLGLEPGASPAAVETAYRAVLERYQPTKVLDLGLEFAVLAVRRLAAATAAFTAIGEAGGL